MANWCVASCVRTLLSLLSSELLPRDAPISAASSWNTRTGSTSALTLANSSQYFESHLYEIWQYCASPKFRMEEYGALRVMAEPQVV